VNAPPAGGLLPPPAGDATHGGTGIERLVHETLQAHANVVRRARAWQQSLTDQQIADTTRSDLARLDAIQDLETLRDVIRALRNGSAR
jgi:hypothetical protein